MRYLSVFSGIEAASVAWVPLGWEPVAFAEVEPFPSAVLAERFPEVANLGDVTKVDWGEWVGAAGAAPDVLVGGSPCQSFSVAGRRDGLAGASGLMWEYVRAVREVRPRWVVWENVPGALSSTHGEDFGCLLRELDGLGYGLAWRVLDAQFFGVAQRRRRLFLVGRLGDPRGPAQVLLEPHCLRWDTPSSRAKREELAARAGRGAQTSCGDGCLTPWDVQSKRIHDPDGTCPTLPSGSAQGGIQPTVATGFSWHNGGKTGLSVGPTSPTVGSNMQPAVAYGFRWHQGSSAGGLGLAEGQSPTLDASKQPAVWCRASGQANAETCVDMAPTLSARSHKDAPLIGARDMVVRRLTPVECERLQGFPDGWTDIPWRGREHAPDTPRYRALGNSMAVPVMAWIGRRLRAVDELEATPIDRPADWWAGREGR